MLPLYCPACKRPVEPGDRFCKGCGASHNPPAPPGSPSLPVPSPVPPAAPPIVAAFLPLASLCCPACGNGDVQKVSGLFQAGAWASQSQGAFGGVIATGNGHLTPFGGATASQTQGVSGLARQLAPPPCPQYTTPLLCFAAILLGGLTGILWLFDCIMNSGSGGNAAHGAFVWLIVICGLVTAGLAFPAWTAAQTQRERHTADMERWRE